MRYRSIAIFLFALFCSCAPLEQRLFDFPVSVVEPSEVSVDISPEILSDVEFPLGNFRITDSVLVAYDISKNFALSVFNKNSGDTLVNLCRKGRGPEEVLLVAPYYNINNGIAGIVDPMTSKYMEIDIPESIIHKRTVIKRRISLAGSQSLASYQNVRMIGKDSLLCYDTKKNPETHSLADVPCFFLYDLRNGNCLEKYNVSKTDILKFGKRRFAVPTTELLLFRDCLIPEIHSVCFGFSHLPLVVFFDYTTGQFQGIKIKDIPEFHRRQNRMYFGHICSDDKYVYVMYYGNNADQWDQVQSVIFKMNFGGNIIAQYKLDGLYSQFEVENGEMYLSKVSDPTHLYILNMGKI